MIVLENVVHFDTKFVIYEQKRQFLSINFIEFVKYILSNIKRGKLVFDIES